MKGNINEFELGVLRTRMVEAARSKACRAELRFRPPDANIRNKDAGVMFGPDLRQREVIPQILVRFNELGRARRVRLTMSDEGDHFPKAV